MTQIYYEITIASPKNLLDASHFLDFDTLVQSLNLYLAVKLV